MKLFLILLTILFSTTDAFGQFTSGSTSNINIIIESQVGFSTQSYQPHWQTFNRYGLINDRSVDGFVLAGFFAERDSIGSFWYDYALQFAGKTIDNESHIHQGFLRLGWGPFEVTGGRWRQTHGLQYDALSSGSLATSTNARPIPRITLAIPDYLTIPFTYDLLAFKGQYSHGWLESGRFVEDAMLHEKFFYARGGREGWPVILYGGIVHYAKWGGVSPVHGAAPSSFDDYLRVIFGRSASEDLTGTSLEGWVINAIGDHLGMIEFGIEFNARDYYLFTYRQFPFEDGSGLRFYSNLDFLQGFHLNLPRENGIVNSILFEVLKTTWQSGPGPTDQPEGDCSLYPEVPECAPDYPFKFGGRDNYYNHSVYRDGWTYFGFNIGSSLLMNKIRGSYYFPDMDFSNHRMFISNRVRAYHIGFEGRFSDSVTYRALATRNSYRGTYSNIDTFGNIINPDNIFASAPVQYYTMLEVDTNLRSVDNFNIKTSLALDFGEFATTFGILTGLSYTF